MLTPDGEVGGELADGAEDRTQHPLTVPHVEEGGEAVEDRHPHVRNRQIHQKTVRRTPHLSLPWKFTISV